MDDKGLSDFNSKVLVVYLANAPHGIEDGIVIEYPQFEKRDGKAFLRGRVPEIDGQDWISQCQTAVVWDSVVHYFEFNSIDEYRRRITQYKPSFWDRLKRLIS